MGVLMLMILFVLHTDTKRLSKRCARMHCRYVGFLQQMLGVPLCAIETLCFFAFTTWPDQATLVHFMVWQTFLTQQHSKCASLPFKSLCFTWDYNFKLSVQLHQYSCRFHARESGDFTVSYCHGLLVMWRHILPFPGFFVLYFTFFWRFFTKDIAA